MFKIRKLKEKDLENGFLETLSRVAFVGLTPREARRIKLGSSATVFVAERFGEIVGTAMLIVTQHFIHRGGKVGHIEDVATKEGFEGRGIGRTLVKYAVLEAEAQGCYKVILSCAEHNIPFYERCGFHPHETTMRMDLRKM